VTNNLYAEYTKNRLQNTKTQLKMGKTPEQTAHQRYTDREGDKREQWRC
jgi:hypothetical protein